MKLIMFFEDGFCRLRLYILKKFFCQSIVVERGDAAVALPVYVNRKQVGCGERRLVRVEIVGAGQYDIGIAVGVNLCGKIGDIVVWRALGSALVISSYNLFICNAVIRAVLFEIGNQLFKFRLFHKSAPARYFKNFLLLGVVCGRGVAVGANTVL